MMKYLICSLLFWAAVSADSQNIDWNNPDPVSTLKTLRQSRKPSRPIQGAAVDDALVEAQRCLKTDIQRDFPNETLTLGAPINIFLLNYERFEKSTPARNPKEFLIDADVDDARLYPVMAGDKIVNEMFFSKEEDGKWHLSSSGEGITSKQIRETRLKLNKAPLNPFLVVFRDRQFLGEFSKPKCAKSAKKLMLTPISRMDEDLGLINGVTYPVDVVFKKYQ